LVWVPIVHTQIDLGSVSESVRALHTRKVGREKWDHHTATIEELWRRIRQEIELLDLDYKRIRLYQDGLPDCDHELEIVRDLAKAGSQNHRLLLELIARGAQLVGTESAELLIEEYELVRLVLEVLGSDEKGTLSKQQAQRSRIILEKRDRYIAERISSTLGRDETGLIFLGMLHSLQDLLPPDIQLTTLSRVAQPARKETETGQKGERSDASEPG